MKKEQIIQAVKDAGVVGCGGAGFPTYIKLKSQAEIILANGSECEPLLNSDKALLDLKPEQVVDGIKYAMQVTGAKKAVIALKEHNEKLINKVKNVLPSDGSITLHPLKNYYPAGDEFITVFDVTRKQIPQGGIPLDVGVLVSNVLTFAQISRAIKGVPVTHRLITITGEVNFPQVVEVPVGTPFDKILEFAGGPAVKDYILIDGGPIMGGLVDGRSGAMAKTTSGLVVLPKNHFITRMKTKSISQMIKLSKAACCQCFRCTDLCPRNLLGHEIYPHLTMRTIDYNLDGPSKHVTSAFLCSQCGVCEMVACDIMMLSPKQIYSEYKKILRNKGINNLHKGKKTYNHSLFEFRKIPMSMILKKLDLNKYYGPIPFLGKKDVNLVRIPINSHIGTIAKPVVNQGQEVKMGEVIAVSGKNEMGTCYHASINGKVTEIKKEYIEITR